MEHVLEVIPGGYLDTSDEEDQMKADDSMDMPTTVTIVEEDGSTSVVDDASIVTEDGSSPIQFAQSSSSNNGGVTTYRVVGIDEPNVYHHQPSGGVVLPQSVNVNGQYYLIGSQNVLGRQVTRPSQIIDARTLGRVKPRDDKKRATHNEVERRRRDKINGWISKLSKIIPNAEEGSKQSQSKGGILGKACEFITELRTTNQRLAAALREHENTAEELDALKQELAELKRENMMLKQQIGPTEDDNTVFVTTSDD